jgi:hypothetical protein
MDMTALALTVVGEFSKVQESIDELVRVYVWQKAPSLVDFLQDEGVFDRIPDRQRPRFVLKLADELKTTADLSKFTDVFHRVKEVRDHLAHGVNTEPIDANALRVTKGYLVGPLTKREQGAARRHVHTPTTDCAITRCAVALAACVLHVLCMAWPVFGGWRRNRA